ncbi:hypothetical protein MSAN_02534100 [Mycena sanguinolenta]|uniref:Uncharacterized protein n=1 Tax=Mycena sanguinolenta TaxID=230812 RepID=A0A8H6TVT2_9AGAR|nr:hypothetical protein MSAN_02534100 [Mycena sanguinolenta]
MFDQEFKELSEEQKDMVVDTQRHEWKWIKDDAKQRVFSTACKKQVLAPGAEGRILPCSECSSVLQDSRFKRAIRRPVPESENFIFVNEVYRNEAAAHVYARIIGIQDIMETADAKNTPCIKFAQATLQGKFKDFKVFSGLIEAMLDKVDRIERGVGMQNFKFPPSWDELTHIINIHSPRAAKYLREHLPVRSQRSFREKESREPRFPMVIEDERTFTLVQNELNALKYDGPLGLSCDDTKLFAGLRLYTDKSKGDFLVGGVEGPIRVANPDAMKRLFGGPHHREGNEAIPIRDNMTAEELLHPLEQILYGLLDRNICVVSYACDGTETERLLQRKLVAKADNVIRHKIPNPTPGAPEFEVVIPFFRGYPVVMIQDSKHALKTFRNNLFTGAKYFVLGNFTAIFRRIYEIAFASDGPLYHRDVVRLDRQDDTSASRLFSAAVLEYLSEKHPDYIGEIVYLFIFGELVDAYQSREIPHTERIKLALRARYFIDAWAKFLEISGYKQQYFLSREAVDIAKFLVDGIISLIFVYRDHVPGTIPLLPWKIVKDFTFLDLIFMIPKIRITMRAAVLSGKCSNGKEAANGYSHTYFDAVGANLAKLAVYPSDDELKQASEDAAAECDSIVALLGITPGQLYEHEHAKLPSVRAWFSEDANKELDDVDDPFEPLEEFDDDESSICEAEELQALINAEESLDAPIRSRDTDDTLMALTCANIALSVDEHMRIKEFEQADEELGAEILRGEQITLNDTFTSIAAALPTLQLPSEPSKPSANMAFDTLDFKALVHQRKLHQTRQAANSARVKNSKPNEDAPLDAEVESTRRQILRRYHELLKEDQSKAVGTAVERQARWSTDPKPTAGNAANAAAAAAAVATKAATRRTKLFKDAKLAPPLLKAVTNAGLTNFKPLLIGSFGIIWTELGLRVARGGYSMLSIRRVEERMASTGAVTEHVNISALSHIDVQVYELAHARNFRAFPQATSLLQTYQFRQLPPFTFLCRLTGTPIVTPMGIELTPEDANLFKDLNSARACLDEAVKMSRSRKKAKELDAEEEDTTVGF